MRSRRRRISLLALVGLLASCGSKQTSLAPELPKELVVAKGATNVRTESHADGSLAVIYDVNDRFPADDVLNLIRSTLIQDRWKPLDEDRLNPGNPSSHVDGWGEFTDGTKHPNTFVHQWAASWEDSNGNLVTYFLRYDSKPGKGGWLDKPDNSALHVVAYRTPALAAQRTREGLGIKKVP